MPSRVRRQLSLFGLTLLTTELDGITPVPSLFHKSSWGYETKNPFALYFGQSRRSYTH